MSFALDVDLGNKQALVKTTVRARPEEFVREVIPLEREDLAGLFFEGPEHSLPALKELRSLHHIIALKIALGEKQIDIQAQLCVSSGLIARLVNDQQFKELVESYRERMVEKSIDHYQLMALVTGESLSAILERLQGESRDEIPLESLARVAERFADRIGHSPVRRSETLNRVRHELSRETIERIKAVHQEDYRFSGARRILPPALEESHKADSESVGASASVATLLFPPLKREIQLSPEKGPDVSARSDEVSPK